MYKSNQNILAQLENRALDVCKAEYNVRKSCILLAGTGLRKISSVECGFSSIKIQYSVNRINEVYVFSIKYRYSDILLKKHKLRL